MEYVRRGSRSTTTNSHDGVLTVKLLREELCKFHSESLAEETRVIKAHIDEALKSIAVPRNLPDPHMIVVDRSDSPVVTQGLTQTQPRPVKFQDKAIVEHSLVHKNWVMRKRYEEHHVSSKKKDGEGKREKMQTRTLTMHSDSAALAYGANRDFPDNDFTAEESAGYFRVLAKERHVTHEDASDWAQEFDVSKFDETRKPPKIACIGRGERIKSDREARQPILFEAPEYAEYVSESAKLFSEDDMVATRSSLTTGVQIYLNTLPQSVLNTKDQNTGEPPGFLSRLVKSSYFDPFFLFMIFLNALSIGVQTDYMARNWCSEVPGFFHATNVMFCVLAALEVIFRLFVYGLSFFTNDQRLSNVFDFLAVVAQVTEEIISFFTKANKNHAASLWRLIRFLRLIRILRIMRLSRALHFFGSLRILVISIVSSLQSLGWVVCVICFQSFICGIPLTQLVTDFKLQNSEHVSKDLEHDLEHYYGSLDRTMLALYGTLSQGILWTDMMVPFVKSGSPYMKAFFTLYSAFAVLAMMNVVNGVFVESALSTAEETRRHSVLMQMKKLFKHLDDDGSGAIDEEEFEKHMQHPKMQHFLKAIDLVPQDSKSLFRLLDVDGSGEIDSGELMAGCSRLQGNAKALDLAVLMLEHAHLSKIQNLQFGRIEQCLVKLLREQDTSESCRPAPPSS